MGGVTSGWGARVASLPVHPIPPPYREHDARLRGYSCGVHGSLRSPSTPFLPPPPLTILTRPSFQPPPLVQAEAVWHRRGGRLVRVCAVGREGPGAGGALVRGADRGARPAGAQADHDGRIHGDFAPALDRGGVRGDQAGLGARPEDQGEEEDQVCQVEQRLCGGC